MKREYQPMLNPSSNDIEVFEEDLKANMRHLFNNVAELPEFHQGFALSLCAWYDEHDKLSSKQMFHACKFWQWINQNVAEAGGVVKPVPSAKKDETPPRVVIDGSRLIALFDKASKELKYPNVKYRIEPGWHFINADHIKFYRTSVMNKRYGEGCVMCIFEWKDTYGVPNKEVLLTIVRDGRTAFGKFCFDKPMLQQELKQIIESPLDAFKVNGIKYSHCCFCGQELNTRESVAAGYGPICADKYGLPWGETPPEQVTLEDL